ncbi:IS110 family transposase [Thiocapsa sp.]|uniref:IS110 family transposase n=1 Tax=Thiocapsa sp. TaxID=2024551 RepID=UPI001BCF2E51|nr:IS110 family transposase [Thiocapsa sp.]
MNTAGIDVAHKTLALAVSTEEKLGKVREFANTPSGHAALIKALQGARVERVCLEATGSYHLDLALAIDAAGLALMVLNPKAAKRFAEALQTRNKSDAVDAGVLAQFARRMPFEPWRRPATEALELRACARRLEALVVDRTRAKNQLHALLQSTTTPAVVLDDVRLSIHQYTAQIDALRDWADARISADEELAQVYRLLTGIPGIAAASAIQLMGELLVLPEDMRAKQWVALAGLDPRQSTSGTSVNKPPRLSKAGNAHLRKALFMPALSAARHEPHVNSYYTHLIEARGLKKIQAICAVMRKLLHAIHAMLKHRQAFDGSRFCLLREAAA